MNELKNKINNDLEIAHPQSGSSSTWSMVELGFVIWFSRRGENESTQRKTSRSKRENQQQIQPTHGVKAGIWTWATLVGSKSSHCSIDKKTRHKGAKRILNGRPNTEWTTLFHALSFLIDPDASPGWSNGKPLYTTFPLLLAQKRTYTAATQRYYGLIWNKHEKQTFGGQSPGLVTYKETCKWSG